MQHRSCNFAYEFIVQLHPAWDGEPQEAVLQSHNYFQVVHIWRLRRKYIASTKDCQLQCMGTIEFLHYFIGVLCREGSSQVKRSGISWNRKRALDISQYFETSGWKRTRTWLKSKLTALSTDVQAATPYQPPHGCCNAGVWQVDRTLLVLSGFCIIKFLSKGLCRTPGWIALTTLAGWRSLDLIQVEYLSSEFFCFLNIYSNIARHRQGSTRSRWRSFQQRMPALRQNSQHWWWYDLSFQFKWTSKSNGQFVTSYH